MPKFNYSFALLAALMVLLMAGPALADPEVRIRNPLAAKNECPPGYYWDSEFGKCQTDRKGGQPCPSTYYWSSSEKRCVKRAGDCPNGQFWHNAKQRCVHPTCPRGFRWSDSLGHCVRF